MVYEKESPKACASQTDETKNCPGALRVRPLHGAAGRHPFQEFIPYLPTPLLTASNLIFIEIYIYIFS